MQNQRPGGANNKNKPPKSHHRDGLETRHRTGLGKSGQGYGQGVLKPMQAASNRTSGEGLGYGSKKKRTKLKLKY